MKTIQFITLLLLAFLALPIYAQGSVKIESPNPNIVVNANSSVYQGKECLLIEINDGKIPFNPPASRLKLLSDDKNSCKSFTLKQISPGKYVTIDDINLTDSLFKLQVSGSSKFKDVTIIFKQQQ